MKTFLKTAIIYTIWALIFSVSSYVYAVGTWNEPSGNPPSGNTDAPINTASYSQTKSGFLWTGGVGSTAGGYFATTLGVGVSTTTNPTALGLTGIFGGKVGATYYCTQDGTKCNNPNNHQAVFTPDSYTKYTATNHNSTAQREIERTFSITKSEVVANIDGAASETRDIVGLIVNYEISVYEANSSHNDARDKWYMVSIVDKESSSNFNRASHALYYDETSTERTDGVYGTNFILWDMNNDDVFNGSLQASRASVSNLFSYTYVHGSIRVIGYITR